MNIKITFEDFTEKVVKDVYKVRELVSRSHYRNDLEVTRHPQGFDEAEELVFRNPVKVEIFL